MIKFLTSDNLFPPLRHSRLSVASRMTTATTFSRQNDAGSRVRTYLENLVLVVVLVLESKALLSKS